MLALVGFLPSSDPRIPGTVAAIEQRLLIEGTFVLRYDSEEVADGLPAGEGAFLACSFWLADNPILLGRHEEAAACSSVSWRYATVSGCSEQYDPLARRQLGNFPQAFSHIALADHRAKPGQVAKPAEARAAVAST